ncbi:glycoside hydrolase family 99-like domain-containing protein [Epilithonimonas sp. UC225_85]|uniref:glycosyltransferase WbsX family protein n=1 Tax=Epilithonimonas sp. UC225_85 TaxID=3350167 RepID=UPI0036D3802C
MNKILPIAIHLPQFHPFPKNDEWWGRGFTEWTNVTKAKPLYSGHYQPHLPADLGFYDLRLEEARLAQEAMAKEYGIYGFCYYHYWFHGEKLMNEPVDRKLNNPKEDLPFMLCWANETWSRRWLGEEKEILIEQTYSLEDHKNHAIYLQKFFKDDRYIKVDGKPVFMIYRPIQIPDLDQVIDIYRSVAKENGFEDMFLVASNSHAGYENLLEKGFDAVMNFQPKLGSLGQAFNDKNSMTKLKRNLELGIFSNKLKIYDYKKAKEKMNRTYEYNYLPCSFVSWDNSARRGENGIIIKDKNPEVFAEFLQKDIKYLLDQKREPEENFLFINAWNEWAEGNYLEPDVKYGFEFLNKLKEVLNKI